MMARLLNQSPSTNLELPSPAQQLRKSFKVTTNGRPYKQTASHLGKRVLSSRQLRAAILALAVTGLAVLGPGCSLRRSQPMPFESRQPYHSSYANCSASPAYKPYVWNNDCMQFCIAALINRDFPQVTLDYLDLSRRLNPQQTGTPWQVASDELQKYFSVTSHKRGFGIVQRELDAGRPVLTSIQCESNHAVLITGCECDANGHPVRWQILDTRLGAGAHAWLAHDKFESAWRTCVNSRLLTLRRLPTPNPSNSIPSISESVKDAGPANRDDRFGSPVRIASSVRTKKVSSPLTGVAYDINRSTNPVNRLYSTSGRTMARPGTRTNDLPVHSHYTGLTANERKLRQIEEILRLTQIYH